MSAGSLRLGRRSFLIGASLVLLGARPAPLRADADAPPLPALFQLTAELYGIPGGVLEAIALQESGRRPAPGEPLSPWPWTLNVAGEGQRFASHTAAWDGISRAVAQRPLPRNIDVGMMQVSWPHNLPRLTDVYLALDPRENLRAAALVLRANYDRCADWWKAVGWYHSFRPVRAEAYRASVRGHYRRLVAVRQGDAAERAG